MRPLLSIIILNYHGLSDTIACLESLRAAELGDAKVMVLENGSGEADVSGLLRWNEKTAFFERIKEVNPREGTGEERAPDDSVEVREHTLLISPVNHGFAGGNNLATGIALVRGDEEVLLLNNDTEVEPDFLTHLLVARTQHPDAVLIPQIRLHGQPGHLWNCGGELRWPGRKVYHYENAPIDALPMDTNLRVTFVTGCALLYRPALTGLLTERFFFGEEDMEFSLRLRRLNIPAYCIPTAIVYHKVGSSLPDNYRKSELFILRRLVNLRVNVGGLEGTLAYAYYSLNLFRLLMLRYGKSPVFSARAVYRIVRDSFELEEVGRELCVQYVQGHDYETSRQPQPD